MQILQEITPLSDDMLYLAKYYFQNKLDFPIHFHSDYELNLTSGVKGTRTVGALVEDLCDYDLVLLFPEVIHCYKRAEGETCQTSEMTVVQFSKDMSKWRVMSTLPMLKIKQMLSLPVSGLKFSPRIARIVKSKIEQIADRTDFEAGVRFLELLSFLADISSPDDVEILGGKEAGEIKNSRSRRIKAIIKFTENNYSHRITLKMIGDEVGMSPSSVCRFFKKKTGMNYWDFLVDYRMECAQRLIASTEMDISEISYACGFNTLSNFNKVFRERNRMTPSQYRKHMSQAATTQL